MKYRNDQSEILTVKMRFLATLDFNKQDLNIKLDYHKLTTNKHRRTSVNSQYQ